MTDVTQELLDMLELEPLEQGLFRGTGSGGETATRIFGGQVIAQALAAAYGTVDDRLCHSLHAYFVRPGDPSIPVIYNVDEARDGRSFTTRRVTAVQHGKQILNMSASFHVAEESWQHQHPMPNVPQPEELISREDYRMAQAHRVSDKRREDYLRPRPFDIREINPQDHFDPKPMSDQNQIWFRMKEAGNITPQMNQCLLAYASDMNLLGSSMRPHGLTWGNGEVMTASLDHSMWFHGSIHFDKWHLYAMDAPFTGAARGFNRGSIYTRDGYLVASVAQEGLVRPMNKS